ncbi:MAG TPA: DUF6600 domain-containing protein [Pseudomonadales bacterium]|nr:DUF6600 domain-containing protein [Pseudomonadales bacterium]
MKRHITQKCLGITILSLMLTVSSMATDSGPPPLVDPPDTNTNDLVNLDTNSPASQITNSVAVAVSPVVLPSNINPSSALGQVVRMLQSGVDESVILAYIYNSNVPFSLNSDQIIYLNDLGASSTVVTTMIQHDQQLGVAMNPQPSPPPQGMEPSGPPPDVAGQPPDTTQPPPDDTNPPPDIDESSFYGALAPYGVWVSLPGYGLCWQPCAGFYTPGWTPYCTQGQWVYSNCGWYWMSRYSWGWCTFHYGRWFCDAHHGWCWYPGTTWAPAWVCWRNSGNYCGWAPLPPHCDYSQGKGLVFNGTVAPVGFNFGLSANQYTFVPTRNLTMAHPDRFRLAPAQASDVFNQTKVENGININNHTFINEGVPAKQVATAAGRPVPTYNIQPQRGMTGNGTRGEQVQADGQTLVVTRPIFNAQAPKTLNQGIKPVLAESQHTAPPATLMVYPNHNASRYNRQDNYTYQYSGNANGQITRVMSPGTPGPNVANPPGHTYWTAQPATPAPAYNDSRYMPPRLEGQTSAQTPQPYQPSEYGQPYQAGSAVAPSRAESYVPNNSSYVAPAPRTYSAPAYPVYSTPVMPGPAVSGYSSFGAARGH